jgi:catechol 2,3-dioxygenase-like lactoylglutathione lyase family enzyme
LASATGKESIMFKIGKLFHLTHVVDNLREADQWYDDVFSACRYYRGYMRAAMRNASVLAIGDTPFEAIQTAPVPGAENSAIGKFHARYGQHVHSIAWYVDSIEATFNQLSKHNVRQVDMVGRPAKGPFGKRNIAVWTHPKDTHGAIEFAQVEDFSIDVRLHPGWSTAYWRDQHPLGIERASHITVVVRDLGKATAFYRDVLGGKLLHEEETPGHKRSAFLAVGEDTVVELAQPLLAQSPEARDLEHAGEGLYSVTFKTLDLARAAQFLESKNQRIEWRGVDSLIINREDSFGIGVGFTQSKIPNDVR